MTNQDAERPHNPRGIGMYPTAEAAHRDAMAITHQMRVTAAPTAEDALVERLHQLPHTYAVAALSTWLKDRDARVAGDAAHQALHAAAVALDLEVQAHDEQDTWIDGHEMAVNWLHARARADQENHR